MYTYGMDDIERIYPSYLEQQTKDVTPVSTSYSGNRNLAIFKSANKTKEQLEREDLKLLNAGFQRTTYKDCTRWINRPF